MNSTARSSSLGLIILGMLLEEPMHAYRMQKLIEQRRKDKVVNVRRGASIYQALERLLRLGLIEIREMVQTESHPDRIIYGITDQGHDTAQAWLREVLITVGADFPSFAAGISVVTMLTPKDAQKQLQIRADAIQSELNKLNTEKREAGDLPRLFLLEDTYRATILESELIWLQSVIADLGSGSLNWDDQWLRDIAVKFTSNDNGGS